MLAAKQLLSIVVLSVLFTIASAQARAGCSRNGTVQYGESCDIFSAREGVSTFQLRHANEAVINSLCYNLYPEEKLCLGLIGEDCTKVKTVGDSDSCASIANAADIPVSTLLTNNLNLHTDCANIYEGMVLCIDSTIINYDYGGRA